MNPRPTISHIITIGDSLFDRGETYTKKIACIPMSFLSGLQGRSPEGSFTNGFVWVDHFIAELANMFTIKKLRQQMKLGLDDISDAIICRDAKVYPIASSFYDLQDKKSASYCGNLFFRTYNEGGLTAYDYSWRPSTSIKRYVSRLILPTLEDKRRELLADDKKRSISKKEKHETLVIEWSGANDLITVNKKPSKAEVDKAIKERIKNINELIKNGYANFILFNLPDISLTPRYQAKNKDERDEAHKWSQYFNDQLQLACEKLRKENPSCVIDLFDASQEFRNMYNRPELYGLEKNKINVPYVDSKDFKMNRDGTSPAKRHMFWDDVHPSADVHALLAYKFFEIYKNKFDFIEPNEVSRLHNRGVFSISTRHHQHPNVSDNNATEVISTIKRTH